MIYLSYFNGDKKMNELIIRNAIIDDDYKIIDLCNRRYGKGYMTNEIFNKLLENPDFFKVATINNEFAGFASFLPENIEKIAKAMGQSMFDIINISGDKPSVIYKSAALEPNFEHGGIMQNLLAKLIEQATNKGYSTVFASAWMIGDTVPIEKTLKKFDFIYVGNCSMLWYGDKEYNCIICGGRCQCNAAIYYKKL